MSPEIGVLCRRFGIPESVFDEVAALEEQETVFVATRAVMEFNDVRPMRRGVRLARIFPHSLKPTTWAMQVFGRHATRNVIDVDIKQAAALVNGGVIEVDSDADSGFVLIRTRGFVVGVGLYKHPVLKSQIPRFRQVEE